MYPHIENLFYADKQKPAKKGTAKFLDALGDSEAAKAYREALGDDGSPSTTYDQAPELTPEEIGRLQAVQDRESGREFVELRRREYLEWAEEFSLGGDDPEQWIEDTFVFHHDGTVGTQGSLDLRRKSLTRLPCNLIRVNGDLDLDSNRLTSLDGLPKEIQGNLILSGNQLSSLHGLSDEVHGFISLSHNKLASLEGLPKEIHGSLYLVGNRFTSMEGLPGEIPGDLNLGSNNLTALDGLSHIVGRNLSLWGNPIVNLDGLRGKKIGGDLDIRDIVSQCVPDGIEVNGRIVVNAHQTALAQDAKRKNYRVLAGGVAL